MALIELHFLFFHCLFALKGTTLCWKELLCFESHSMLKGTILSLKQLPFTEEFVWYTMNLFAYCEYNIFWCVYWYVFCSLNIVLKRKHLWGKCEAWTSSSRTPGWTNHGRVKVLKRIKKGSWEEWYGIIYHYFPQA